MASSGCERVLVANRGEIAVRIARACRAVGAVPIAVASDVDVAAPHVAAADHVAVLGPAPARDSYLAIDKVLDAARRTGATAVHPGYGFLSENAAFAQAVVDAGLTWIGPPPDAIRTMGDKVAARRTVTAAGVPVVPGAEIDAADRNAAARAAAALGYPLLVKAAAGGGGKGMRAVTAPGDLDAALAAAAREATGAFGDGRVYLERLLRRPRHVEVQILGDAHGTLVHLGERECSIQRRHQKIVEESPCPVMTPALRARMTEAALATARAVDYVNAGTIEFLLDEDGTFYFLEMNTRLQVEHPVTELVTGIDLVAAQLRIARGEPLGVTQGDVAARGHAVEARVYAEDPARGFLPSAGPIFALREPQGPGVRVDGGVRTGTVVPVDYDPMLAKVCAWGATRGEALARLRAAVADTVVLGPSTNLAFLSAVLAHPAVEAGDTYTSFVDEHLGSWTPPAGDARLALVAAALHGQHAAADGGGARPLGPWERLGPWRLGR
jgi:acetyl-CoA/propionyl-CoA carboxylase biotin carboxyl carrier protein